MEASFWKWTIVFFTSLTSLAIASPLHSNYSYWDDEYYENSEEHYDDTGHSEVVVDIPVGDEEPINEAPLHLLKDSDPNSPAISFSSDAEFRGTELFFDGHGLSLPKPFRTKSHRFKGGVNWTIYPGSNYSGSAMCLISDPGHPVTGNGMHDITIGSIRRGCWCNDSVKMVKPKPRSKLGATALSGVQFWSERNAVGNSAYTDGRETRFPYPIDMRSFQLLGKWIPWTLFSRADLTGDSSCLVADREGGSASYVFTNIPRPFSVSSVQQACVATTSFEFAGVGDTLEEGKELDKVQVDENEVPVMPEGDGTLGGGRVSEAGIGGGEIGRGGAAGEIGNEIEGKTDIEGSLDNGDAKERGGDGTTGGAWGLMQPTTLVIFLMGVATISK